MAMNTHNMNEMQYHRIVCLLKFIRTEFGGNFKPGRSFDQHDAEELSRLYPEIWKEYDQSY